MTQRFIAALLKQVLPLVFFAGLAAAGTAQSYPPAFSAGSSYAIGDQVQLNGNVLRCVHAVTPGGFKYNEWELWEVRANSVYMVGAGQTFTSLTTAWQFALNARIAQGAYLHFYISSAKGAFSQTFSAPFSLDHPFGPAISIIGDKLAGNTLNFQGLGFLIDGGHSFGTLESLTIKGMGGVGIQAIGDSSISSVYTCAIANFGTGLDAEDGGQITASFPSIQNFATGIKAFYRSSVILSGAISLDGLDTSNTTGLFEAFDSYIDAQGTQIQRCKTGVLATQGGVINFQAGGVSNNGIGIHANMHAHVNFEDGFFLTPNTQNDITADTGGTVDATSADTGNNAVGSGDGSFIYS